MTGRDLFGNTTTLRHIDGEDYGGIIVHESADAYLFRTPVEGRDLEVWIAKSQCLVLSEADRYMNSTTRRWERPATLRISDWLAREKGLMPSRFSTP